MPIFQSAFGERHPNVGVLHGYVCRALVELGRLDEALEHCEAGLDLVVEGLGPESERAGDVLRTLAELHRARKDEEKAQELFGRAVRAFSVALGKDHKKTRETLAEIRTDR